MANIANYNRLVIEIEDFISKIRAKTCLWDQKDPNYFKRDYQRVAWMEIADETNAPVNELKKKWRGLRDTFCRELRKMDTSKSDDELVGSCYWRHFRCLLFLRDVVSSAKKPSKRSRLHYCPKQDDYHANGDDVDNGDDTMDNGDYANSSDRSSSPESGYQDPLTAEIAVKHEPGSPLTSGRRKELKCVQENAIDSDAQFLMSLLPFLQDVPKKRKLLVRARLTQVLMDEQNVQEYH